MQRLGMEEGVPIEHGMVTRAIERAQKKVEAQNFDVRKHLLEYDDVMNKQRESIALRRQLLEGKIQFEEKTGRGGNRREPRVCSDLGEGSSSPLSTAISARGGDPEDRDYGACKAVAETFGIEPAELDPMTSRGCLPARSPTYSGRRSAKYENKEQLGPGRDPASRRARHHAADRRCPVEGPPLQP